MDQKEKNKIIDNFSNYEFYSYVYNGYYDYDLIWKNIKMIYVDMGYSMSQVEKVLGNKEKEIKDKIRNLLFNEIAELKKDLDK